MAVVKRPASPSSGAASCFRSYRVYIPLFVMMACLVIYKPDVSSDLDPAATEKKKDLPTSGSMALIGDDEEPVKPRIGAYYYTWYNKDQWDQWKTKLKPELGLYNSNNSTVISAHTKWALRAGIDFFLMSYANNAEQIAEYLDHKDSMQIALHIESLAIYEDAVKRYMSKTGADPNTWGYSGMMDFNAPAISPHNPDKITTFSEVFTQALFKAMTDIFKKYRPKYAKVSNRPIFIVYLARDFQNYHYHIKKMRDKFTKKFNMQPYLIADTIWFDDDVTRKHNHDKYAGSTWDSLTAYNRYEGMRGENLQEYLQRIEYEYELHARKTTIAPWFWEGEDKKRMTMVPYVQPMYDDMLIRSHIHAENTTRPVYDYDGGKTYQKFWDVAKRILDRNPCDNMHTDEHFVFISSFNEWHESTSIEPSKEHGNHLLHLTLERSSHLNMQCDLGSLRQIPKLKTKHELRGY